MGIGPDQVRGATKMPRNISGSDDAEISLFKRAAGHLFSSLKQTQHCFKYNFPVGSD